jgi:cob(I)alamin adenosyltransferase
MNSCQFLLKKLFASNANILKIPAISQLCIRSNDLIFNSKNITRHFATDESSIGDAASTGVNSSRRIKIYTRTGDKGKSSLFTGERRVKNDAIFDALGNADELNSSLGLAREFCLEMLTGNQSFNKDIETKLIRIQSILLDIGSHIATPRSKAEQSQLDRLANFDSCLIEELESWIDRYDHELPILKNFILPSGGKCASTIHLSRAICRRLERSMQPLLQSNDIDKNVCVYVNRLSDFLFVCARYCSFKEKKVETIYKKA